MGACRAYKAWATWGAREGVVVGPGRGKGWGGAGGDGIGAENIYVFLCTKRHTSTRIPQGIPVTSVIRVPIRVSCVCLCVSRVSRLSPVFLILSKDTGMPVVRYRYRYQYR